MRGDEARQRRRGRDLAWRTASIDRSMTRSIRSEAMRARSRVAGSPEGSAKKSEERATDHSANAISFSILSPK